MIWERATGREVGRLLARPALPVDRRGRHRLRKPGREHGVARDVQRLLTALRHAAADHVVHLRRVEAVALDQLDQDGGEQVDRVHAR